MTLGRDDMAQLPYFRALKARLRAERSANFARSLATDPWWQQAAELLDKLAWVYQLEQDYALDRPRT